MFYPAEYRGNPLGILEGQKRNQGLLLGEHESWDSRDCWVHLSPEGINLETPFPATQEEEKREDQDQALELEACASGL